METTDLETRVEDWCAEHPGYGPDNYPDYFRAAGTPLVGNDEYAATDALMAAWHEATVDRRLSPPCAACGQGHHRHVSKPKVRERDSRIAVITDIPVRECDACGDTLLDEYVASRLDELFADALASNQVTVRRYTAILTPDVTGVRVVDDYVVEVAFADGAVGEYDFAGKLWGAVFKPLREDYSQFAAVQPGMGTIVWPVGDDPDGWPDWSPEELYIHIREGQRPSSRPVPGELPGELPTLAADLTWTRINGGRAFAAITNWDEDRDPVVGERVLAADGGSERPEAVITELRGDGTIILTVPRYAPELPADLNNEDDDGNGYARISVAEFRPSQVFPGARLVAGREPGSAGPVTVLRTELLRTAGGEATVLVTFDKDV